MNKSLNVDETTTTLQCAVVMIYVTNLILVFVFRDCYYKISKKSFRVYWKEVAKDGNS